MRRSGRIWILFSMLFGLEGVVAGQSMMESTLGASRAVTTTSPTRGVSKAIDGVMDSLGRVMKTNRVSPSSEPIGTPAVMRPGRPAATPRARVMAVAPEPVAVMIPARTYEDPRNIRAGMANDELVRRFGPAALEVTGAESGKTLTYSGKSNVLQLELRDQKVALIELMNRQQAAVILPVGQGFQPYK